MAKTVQTQYLKAMGEKLWQEISLAHTFGGTTPITKSKRGVRASWACFHRFITNPTH